MSPTAFAQNSLSSALAFSVVGVLFSWVLWRVVQRHARGLVIGVWLGAAVGVTALMTLQIHRTQTALGVSAALTARCPVFWWFLPMWVVALEAVALTVRRRVRVGDSRFSAGVAGRSLGAFWLGVLAYFVVFVALDIAAIIR
jgi:hypothetical protein